jgi:hypothetical protein
MRRGGGSVAHRTRIRRLCCRTGRSTSAIRTRDGCAPRAAPRIQGYNAQAAVNENQIILGAEVTIDPPDFGHLEPMVNATRCELQNIGVHEQPDTVVADAGYWHKTQMQAIAERGIELAIPPTAGCAKATAPAGRTASTPSCASCCRPTAAKRSTDSARSRSSQCSDRSNSTAGSTASNEEADPPRSRSGGWWQQPTISSSSTPTGSRTPPEERVHHHTPVNLHPVPRNRPKPDSRIFRQPPVRASASVSEPKTFGVLVSHCGCPVCAFRKAHTAQLAAATPR